MRLELNAKYGNDRDQNHFATTERETFELDGKTWRIENVIVQRSGIWISVERQTKAGKNYARGHGRAIPFAELPADVANAILDALTVAAKPEPVERKRLGTTRLEDFRDGISYEQRGLSWMTQSDLGYDLAEREGIDDQMGRRLIEAACSGLPLVITWRKSIRDGRFEYTTATALVQAVVPGRIRVYYWGFEHFVYIADLVEVSVPLTKWEVVDPQADAEPVAQEEPEVDLPDAEAPELPDTGELLLAPGKTGELATMRPGSVGLSNESLKLFLDYARDAGNWGGVPLVGGNVGGGYEANGYLMHLKQAGLITTERDGWAVWLYFTPRGVKFAKEHGVTIPVR